MLKYWREFEEEFETQLIYIYYVVLVLMEINKEINASIIKARDIFQAWTFQVFFGWAAGREGWCVSLCVKISSIRNIFSTAILLPYFNFQDKYMDTRSRIYLSVYFDLPVAYLAKLRS